MVWSRDGQPSRVLQLSWFEINFATSSVVNIISVGKDFFPEGTNYSQTVFIGRESCHQTSNTEDSNSVFELSTESSNRRRLLSDKARSFET